MRSIPKRETSVGRLHLVATPIGNLEDVTLRALRVLAEADLLLAEDTRRTRTLLSRHGIEARPHSLHAHNESARIERVLAVLAGDGDVALVSDAGTPLVSDPGERLVAAAIEAGHDVVPVPGASALLAGLAIAGLPAAEGFTFVGFLPRKKGARDARLAELRMHRETLVFFESPRRVAATLRALCEALGDRPACLARELTKLHEEAARGGLSELADRYRDGTRGEITLIVAGAGDPDPPDPASIDAAIRDSLAAGHSPRDTAAEVADRFGLPRSSIYPRVIALR